MANSTFIFTIRTQLRLFCKLMSNIPNSTAEKYKPKTPPQPESFWNKLYTAVTRSNSNTGSDPVKARLINSWQDLNFQRINIVVCNYLYEDENRWVEIERATGVRRENIFYGVSAFLVFLFVLNNIMASIILFGAIVIPTLYTMLALGDENAEEQKYWLRYWVIYGVFSFCEGMLKRIWPEIPAEYAKLVLVFLTCLPYAPSFSILFETIKAPFLSLRQKFQQYNYQNVE